MPNVNGIDTNYNYRMNLEEEYKIVGEYVKHTFDNAFDVSLNDPNNPTHFVGDAIFPDVILRDKDSNEVRFVIEVKKNGDFANSLNDIKALAELPFTIYVIVPLKDIQNARRIAELSRLSIKLGFYEIVDDKVVNITYD